MSQALAQLIQLLRLTQLNETCFQGESQDLGLPQVFGGQILAQSLAAAMAIAGKDRWVNSCHAYFLRAGSAKHPIVYETKVMRQGHSFSVVAVEAKQQDETLLSFTASFHLDEQGWEHQIALENQVPMEACYAENTLMAQMATLLPPHLQQLFSGEKAFDVRLRYPNNPFKGKRLLPEQQLWVKANGHICERYLQQCLFAYFSDFHCITTMLHSHECGVFEPKVRFATLEHSIHFHREFDFSQWLYFAIKSPIATNARGFASGQVFNQTGKLIASYHQEALIRPI